MADPERGRLGGAQTYTRIPTVVVDDLHVIYKVQGPTGAAASPVAAFKRVLTGSSRAAVREVHAVKGVSFAAYEGDAIGLIGTNGSGKSTLLRAIAGLILPARGAVYTRHQPSLLGVNAVLQNDMPGDWNVMLGLLAMGMRRSEARARIEEIIEFSGINERGDFASLPMKTYSSGMAARLRFAIAAAKEHDVLLIDEALATGDAKFRKRSAERVQQLREGAGTVFLVSHDSQSIRSSCERTIWLESGVIRMDGPTDEVMDAYEEFTKQSSSPAPAKKAAPQKAAPQKAAPPKPTPTAAAPKEAAPKESAPKESAPKQAAPSAPKDAATTASTGSPAPAGVPATPAAPPASATPAAPAPVPPPPAAPVPASAPPAPPAPAPPPPFAPGPPPQPAPAGPPASTVPPVAPPVHDPSMDTRAPYAPPPPPPTRRSGGRHRAE